MTWFQMQESLHLNARVFMFKLLFGLHLASLSGLFAEGHFIGNSSCGLRALHHW